MPATDLVSPLAPPPANPTRPPKGLNGGMIRRILLVVFLLGVAAVLVWKIKANRREADALTAKSDADANQAIPVSVAAAVAKPMPIYLTELGTVTAFNTVTVKSRVDGQLLSVNVREGQAVRQGELLATIDPRPYQAALDQAKGQLVKDEAAAPSMRRRRRRGIRRCWRPVWSARNRSRRRPRRRDRRRARWRRIGRRSRRRR